ncbi:MULTISPECIES: hypothetical protein [Thermoactinomyces]|jgi:hypothetical protein|uniref:Uncharacterized protein n=1 Tax=Thermoactinomyces daqus TaxID=1329516 RepID=A0A7W1XCH9_9BACL|nr:MULTISPECIES: hypothetical protein [Thermoactinomyces]MBA4544044.1 hypothetical protein [Thermoactinomyces daqus]MBH8598138.1 hypothetical protein [Thermoactinomyces sp. CICC 10523]MBH8603169.1 hypothetical protein [Thermoactinomyces sp. CICC 10522]MBH8607024.1 hypothetical protein [Thermoactinomyces sp. CICC 10521]
MNNNDALYQDLVNTINQTVGRRAVSVRKMKQLIAEARRIRMQYGVMGLWSYAQQLPEHFFTREELEKLQNSPRLYELSDKMVDAMVVEQVITPTEARMIKRTIYRNWGNWAGTYR